jgi:hypothetical protein
LKAELAAEKSARADVQKKADRAHLRDTFRPKLLAAGAFPAALDIALDKLEPVFTVENDTVKAKTAFSTERPGEPLSPDEWIVGAIKEFPFLFGQSAGGGAAPKSGLLGGGSNQKELVNPSAHELGENATAISQGKLKVVYR